MPLSDKQRQNIEDEITALTNDSGFALLDIQTLEWYCYPQEDIDFAGAAITWNNRRIDALRAQLDE